MTDTTDTAALRELLSHENLESDHHVGVTVTTLRLLLSKADQFEAERQRADEAVKERRESIAARRKSSTQWREQFDAVHLRARKAEAELAALKGDQVPVAWLNDAHLARGHIEGEAGEEDAGPGMIPVYRERFSAPQKPVLHPQLLSDIRQCVIDATAWCTHRTPPDYVSNVNAWLADGGIVKDGE